MYSKVFDEFDRQGWNNNTKLSLVLDFLDKTKEPTPEKFYYFLEEIAEEENILSDEEE